MTEQKAKSAIKKVTTAKSGAAPDVKSKAGKVTVAAKKPVVKKPVVKKPTAEIPAAKTLPLSPAKLKTAKPPKKVAAAAVENKAPPVKAGNDKADPATAVRTAAKSTPKTAAKPTPEERYRMVETAAYFIAEQHGFQGRSDEHWAAAEREIAAKLGQ